ncbi:MAG: Bug family tripartite tricarboxylate transporter substrate binding protein [Betaproteobacteria bacterium]
MFSHRLLSVVAGALFAIGFASAHAQGPADYPGKPIRIVVPFPPGGATDLITRNVAQKLSEGWRQPVIVENRAGANGTIGADVVAKAPPDGYTYLAATIAHAANVSLIPNAPYQLLRDLRPVAIMGLIPLVPVVRADSPVRSLQDLVAQSKQKALNAGSSGNGTAAHLTLELFKGATGARIQHVAYKGGAPAMTDLLGGQIDVIFALLPECLPHVKAGKLRALAIMSDQRYPLLPDVPTSAEAGIPGIEVTSWNGIMLPAGTPSAIVARVNAEISQITAAPDMKAKIVEAGYQPVAMGVPETEHFVRGDVERWAKVVREANIKVD